MLPIQKYKKLGSMLVLYNSLPPGFVMLIIIWASQSLVHWNSTLVYDSLFINLGSFIHIILWAEVIKSCHKYLSYVLVRWVICTKFSASMFFFSWLMIIQIVFDKLCAQVVYFLRYWLSYMYLSYRKRELHIWCTSLCMTLSMETLYSC